MDYLAPTEIQARYVGVKNEKVHRDTAGHPMNAGISLANRNVSPIDAFLIPW
jgi:hypothetical protein